VYSPAPACRSFSGDGRQRQAVHMAATETPTLREQRALELRVAEIYEELATCMEGEERDEQLLLLRDRHARFLAAGLGHLPAGFVSLDASRPWIVYWALHGLALLGLQLDTLQGVAPSRENVLAFLAACQHPTGGFGGGPGQLAHLAPTYAAVGALLTLGGRDALDIIDRGAMFEFLCRMAVPPKAGGGFRMHEGVCARVCVIRCRVS
jgi:protein farnesyltransferase subunit beta